MIITLAHMFNHVFMRMHQALIPVLRQELNLDWFTVGLIPTIPLVFQAIMSIPSGLMADRYNHRYLIAASIILTGVAAFTVSQTQGVSLLILALSILAFSSTFYHPPAYSYTSELLEPSQRSRALGVHGAGGTLGTSIGPITLSLIMAYVGWRSVYLLWAGPVLIFAIIVLARLKPRQKLGEKDVRLEDPESGSASIKSIFSKSLLVFLTMIGVRAFGVQALDSYMTSYLTGTRGIPVELAIGLFSVSPMVGLVSSPFGGYFADRLGEKRWLTVTFAGNVACIAGMAFSPSIYGVFAFNLLHGFFQFAGMAAESSLIATFTPRSRRGLGYSLFFLPSNLVGSVAPVIASFIVSGFGIWYIFPISIVSFITAILILQRIVA